MPNKPTVPEEEFLQILYELGAQATATKLRISVRNVHERRRRIEKRDGKIVGAKGRRALQSTDFEAKENQYLTVKDGIVIIGSDAHYWPGMISTAHEGFLKLCGELDPKAVILNGDVLDGAKISRWPPPGWEYQPDLFEEIDVCFDRLEEIRAAAPKAQHHWTYGNHDQRLELFIATHAAELKKLKGVRLQDHFPKWKRSYNVLINHRVGWMGGVLVTHSIRGGKYAPANNVLAAGMNVVTGHLHSAKSMPQTNFHSTVWGVDSGCLAEPKGRQFSGYTNANPTDWRSGFAVLTFDNGKLLQPELCLTVKTGVMQFRGEMFDV